MIRKAFLFPGQGSQYVGMGKKLCEKDDLAKETFEEANKALGYDLMKLCFNGDLDELTKTENAQPAILTVGVAMFRVLESKGVTPEFMAGHSLGELTALTCAGAISFSDAVVLAKLRGKYMQEAVPAGHGAMAAIMTRDMDMVYEECSKLSSADNIVSISNYNSKTQCVVSGNVEAVSQLVEVMNGKNLKTKMLNVSAPFHCPLMQTAADNFKVELEKIEFSDLKYPVISNVTAQPYAGKEEIINNLVSQIVKPVKWSDSMTFLKKSMVQYCVEVGAGHILRNMMKTNVSDIKVFALDDANDESKIYDYVESCNFPFISRTMGIVVATKNNNWNEQEYKLGVVEPYNKLIAMQQIIEKEERKANIQEMNEALQLLLLILKTKQTPIEERVSRLHQLFEDTGTKDIFKDFDFDAIKD